MSFARCCSSTSIAISVRERQPHGLLLLIRSDAAVAEHVEECFTDLDAEVILRVECVEPAIRSVFAEVLSEGGGRDRDDSRRRASSRRHLGSAGERVPQGGFDRVCGVRRRLVLPHPNDAPPGGPKVRVGLPIAGDIPRELVCPPGGVRLRTRCMLRTRVPEAPIHEDGHLRPREHDVCSAPAGQDCTLDEVSAPAPMKLLANRELSSGVAIANSGHPSAGRSVRPHGVYRAVLHQQVR